VADDIGIEPHQADAIDPRQGREGSLPHFIQRTIRTCEDVNFSPA
jgi:hypothetical protein